MKTTKANTTDNESEATMGNERIVICTGCGIEIPESEAEYMDHADTYSGTQWHCEACAKVCHEPSEE